MIILSVGHQQFKIQSLDEANTLLSIFSTAIPLRTSYSEQELTYSIDSNAEFSIKIVAGEVTK